MNFAKFAVAQKRPSHWVMTIIVFDTNWARKGGQEDVALHLKSMWNTFSVRLSRSVESATEAISLTLHSVSHALKGRVWLVLNYLQFLSIFHQNYYWFVITYPYHTLTEDEKKSNYLLYKKEIDFGFSFWQKKIPPKQHAFRTINQCIGKFFKIFESNIAITVCYANFF